MVRNRVIRTTVVTVLAVAWLGIAAAVCDVLDTKEVKLELQNVTLENALTDLARQAEYTVKIETSAQDAGQKRITLIVDKPVQLRTAIALVTTYAGVKYMVRDKEIVVFRTIDGSEVNIQRAKAEGALNEWVARTYDVRELVSYSRSVFSPFARRRVGSYLKTGGHPTYIDGRWGDFAVVAGSGELFNYDNLYYGFNEEEYERAVMLNKARSLVSNIMNTINPGIWAPPIIHEEVTELAAPELAGVPPQEAIERAIASGKSGIIIYRDGQLTVLVKKGTPLQTTYLGHESEQRISTEGGIGIKVTVDANGYLVIDRVLKGEPADIAGLQNGDIILGVDQNSVEGMTLDQVASLIKGPMGSKVVLDIVRGQPAERRKFEVVRAPMKAQK